jgi:hypothetical protein
MAGDRNISVDYRPTPMLWISSMIGNPRIAIGAPLS